MNICLFTGNCRKKTITSTLPISDRLRCSFKIMFFRKEWGRNHSTYGFTKVSSERNLILSITSLYFQNSREEIFETLFFFRDNLISKIRRIEVSRKFHVHCNKISCLKNSTWQKKTNKLQYNTVPCGFASQYSKMLSQLLNKSHWSYSSIFANPAAQ